MKTEEQRVPLNARVTLKVRRAFDVEVAKRGMTKQDAIQEALRLWIDVNSREGETLPVRFPLIRGKGNRKFNLTREQVAEAILG